MRFYYVALAAAIALVMSADGLQAVPNSAESTSLRTVAETGDQSVVEGKTQRILVGELQNPTQYGYGFSTLQKNDNNVRQQNLGDSYDDSDSDVRTRRPYVQRTPPQVMRPAPAPVNQYDDSDDDSYEKKIRRVSNSFS